MKCKGLIYQATHQSGRLVCWAECRQMPTARRTYQERAFLTRGKHRRLDEAFRECAHLCNAALEEWWIWLPWRAAYRQAGVGRTYYDQAKELTAIRAQDHFWGSVSIQVGLQRRIARCRRGSKTRRKLVSQLAKLRHRVYISNRNDCHRIRTELVRRYGVVVEDLAITDMTGSARGTIEDPDKNVKARSGLNRSIQEQTWGLMRQQLAYKTEW